ncbi:MAG: hemerythrin domain-containing protein [Saprospiraceae bacterium]
MKRMLSLQPLSREHRDILSFCWNIKQGIKNKTESTRLINYAKWFWDNQLKNHFEIEEKLLFPLLSQDNILISQSLLEHNAISNMFENISADKIVELQSKLYEHIRFEERTLYNEIQNSLKDEQLNKVGNLISSKNTKCPLWIDKFWEV